MLNYNKNFVIFFILSAIFVLFVPIGFFDGIDLFVYEWTSFVANPFLDNFWRMFTLLGETEALALLSLIIVVFLFRNKKYSEITLYLFMMSIGIVLTLVLKLLIKKDRPGEVEYIDFWGYGNHIISYSFPSGHAVKSFLVFSFLIWYVRRNYQQLKTLAVITTVFTMVFLLCGIGQMFLEEHYISDVIGGYFIGFTCFSFSLSVYERWMKSRTIKISSPFKKEVVSK